MGSMVFPVLFSKSAIFTITNAKYILTKHKHLLNIKNNASIMEFGFADGSNSRNNLAPLLGTDYKEYIATDISKPMVDYAKKNIIIPKGEIQQLDIATENVPIGFRQRFDYVFSMFTMRLNIAKEAFKNIHTMLKPEGETFQILYKRLPLQYAIDLFNIHPKWKKYENKVVEEPYLKTDPKDIYEKSIRESKLTIFNFEQEEITYTFPNEQAWKDLFVSVNPIISNIPPEELEEYKNDLFSEVRRQLLHQDNDGKKNDDGKPFDKMTFTTYVILAKK